jgi:hypothetical protein
MSEVDQSTAGPKEVPGWVCFCIAIGFIGGLATLIAIVRVLGGS